MKKPEDISIAPTLEGGITQTAKPDLAADIEKLRYWLQAHMRNFRFVHEEKEAEAICDRLLEAIKR